MKVPFHSWNLCFQTYFSHLIILYQDSMTINDDLKRSFRNVKYYWQFCFCTTCSLNIYCQFSNSWNVLRRINPNSMVLCMHKRVVEARIKFGILLERTFTLSWRYWKCENDLPFLLFDLHLRWGFVIWMCRREMNKSKYTL